MSAGTLLVSEEYVNDLVARKARHEIHTSERRSFRSCRRRWDWVFRGNYYPIKTAKPLEFGIAYHKAMEVLHSPTTWMLPNKTLGVLAVKAFVDLCETQRSEYLRLKDLYALEGDDASDYDERIALGRGMIWYYVNNQLSTIRERFTPSHVEVSFDVPLRDESGNFLLCKCDPCRKAFARSGGGKWYGNPIVISGRVDLIVYDTDGFYWIWDWKTAAQLSTSEMFLELDDQIATYVWALRIGLGLDIRGFLYHEQRKGFPNPPKENKTVRLGRKFSVNKNQTTDYDTYLKTVKEHDADAYAAGAYDDFLNMLHELGVDFYRRFKVYKSEYELWQVGINLLAEVRDMTDPHLRIYPTPGKFNCQNCAFQVPCISKNAGQDYEYTLQTLYLQQEPYYRRKVAPSTETKGGE